MVKLSEQCFGQTNIRGEQLEVFRRMIFNIAIGNTEDHPRNHVFIDGELRPCFDVSPQMNHGNHSLNISSHGSFVSVDSIVQSGSEFGLSEDQSSEVVQSVLDATENWKEEFLNSGLTQLDINMISPSFSQRAKLKQALSKLNSVERTHKMGYSTSL